VTTYPLRHISIRVPWHDSGWDGRVCANPRLNGACLKLKRIGQNRDDAAEEAVASQSIKDLPQEKWPCCVVERVGFMAPFEYTRMANHPYNRGPEGAHGHFAQTPLRHPPYSAGAVPFAWLLIEEMTKLGEEHALDVQSEREPDLGFDNEWVQDHRNQTALLDCFADHLPPKESLCFFYAKKVPFVEDYGASRVLIGVGRVTNVAPCYKYVTKDLKGKLRSVLWERMVQHSIRPDFKDGFILPYHAALKELAESRLSVLIGPAGTGKTTLLSVLCSHQQIADGGVLLLAPTGKARVRMEQSTSHLSLKGYTIAQFLSPHRYNRSTGRYQLSDKPVEVGARTVIIDESSMLTEEMLAALIQALKGVHRLILIGDPRQLPPIGAGRPFRDIVKYLAPEGIVERFPRVGPGYAELTIRMRQVGEDREDLQLAEWFSGAPIAPGEDDVFDRVVGTGKSKHVRFVQWDSPDDLRSRLIEVLAEELKFNGPDDIASFDATLGGTDWNGMRFFNFGAAEKAESWQILSPVRAGPHGVPDVNRLIHKRFRQEMIDASRKVRRKYPKPMGPEEIVYGDKVINLDNTDPSLPWYRHRKVYPAKDSPYIANGEIGMAVGFFRRRGLPDLRYKLEVEFSSQPRFKYDFTGRDFSEEGSPALELAYALTVHKSQGSEFGIVFLVLPNPCRLLSRELLYTALTRQKDRIVILHQGPRAELRKYSSDNQSETARRLTNLFSPAAPITIDGRIFEENLIHRTKREEMVRSKSEVIIANELAYQKVEYSYEQPLTIDSVTKYPDFTIEDVESGRNFYWEHCGMLHVPRYRRRWEEKLAWYKANGILLHEEGGGPRGTLIVTRDEANGSIDSGKISQIIKTVLDA